jgi:hypothetical protein
MRQLAAFVMAGRIQAILLACGLSLVSWAIPFFGLLAAAAAALPTLRKGAREGGIIIAGALALLTLVGGAWLGSSLGAVGYGVSLWVPIWLGAVVLRESGRLSWALMSIVALGILAVAVVYGFLSNPAALWFEGLRQILLPALSRTPENFNEATISQSLEKFSHLMTGLVAAGSVLSLILSLLIARWWQAELYNPGGFRREFLSLQLSVTVAYGGIGLFVLAMMSSGKMAEMTWNLVFPYFVLFFLVGFSVLHALLSGKGSRKFWLYGIYAALIIIPHMILPIILLGLSDIWIDWRRRLKAS